MDKVLCLAAGAVNDDSDSSNIIFNIKNTKRYVPVVTLSAEEN